MLYNLNQIEDISNGDNNFMKEMIEIFMGQIPEFVANMKLFLENGDWQSLAREAHTTKSSVLVFGMEETGKIFKEIQLLGEGQKRNEINELLPKGINDLEAVLKQLQEYIQGL